MQMVRKLTSWRIAFCADPGTFIVHPPAASWSKLLQQRSRWASNAPILARLDPLFFTYMAIAYLLNVFTLAAPLLWAVGALRLEWIWGLLLVKWGGEACMFARSLALSHRGELRRYWPLWALLQPLHVVIVGGLGPLGIFSWKGRRHRWGQQRADGSARCITD